MSNPFLFIATGRRIALSVSAVAFSLGACTGDITGVASSGPDAGAEEGSDTPKGDDPDRDPGDPGEPVSPDRDDSIWSPAPGTSWQWQLTGSIETGMDVEAFDVDLFDAPAETLTALDQSGRVVICYFSAGSHEDWRSDAAQFPAEAIGAQLAGWAGERWLDVRHSQVRSIMRARLDLAVERGCDAVEPDNIDGYANDSGFALTASDQLEYNRFLADEAHARGLSIGLKNDLAQVPQLVDHFDWALNEECMVYDECEALLPFIEAGKAVFHVEYGDATMESSVCPEARRLGFDTLIKNLELDAWRISCE